MQTLGVEPDGEQVEGGVERVGPQCGRVDLGGERVQVDHAVKGVEPSWKPTQWRRAPR